MSNNRLSSDYLYSYTQNFEAIKNILRTGFRYLATMYKKIILFAFVTYYQNIAVITRQFMAKMLWHLKKNGELKMEFLR